jgi:ABC-type glycerol-3-phosphate transport system substrate-binding protein
VVDQPKPREALQWLADLIHRHRVWPQAEDLREAGVANLLQLFTGGRLAMWYDGLWQNDTLLRTPPVFPYEMVEAPRGAAGRSGFFHQGPFHIGKDTRVPDQTWAFLAWLAGAEGQKEYMKRIPGGVPARRSVGKELGATVPAAALATMEYSRDYPLHPELDKLDAAYVQGLNPVWRGESGVAAATEGIAREQNRILAQTGA